jgi:uncharacterized protein YciI
MFIVLLEFTGDRGKAAELAEAHGEWIARGFDDGAFVLTGGLRPNRGGGILVHDTTRADLERRLDDDPFVAEGVVNARILELAPWRADARLSFLVEEAG